MGPHHRTKLALNYPAVGQCSFLAKEESAKKCSRDDVGSSQ